MKIENRSTNCVKNLILQSLLFTELLKNQDNSQTQFAESQERLKRIRLSE